MTFRMLQDSAETNPAVLNARLKELRAACLVHREERGYALSEEGNALLALLLPLNGWANRWALRSEALRVDNAAKPKPKRR